MESDIEPSSHGTMVYKPITSGFRISAHDAIPSFSVSLTCKTAFTERKREEERDRG